MVELIKCTRFGKTLRMGFIEFDIWLISSNPCSSFRLIGRFVVETQRFVCDHATPPIIEKLRCRSAACPSVYSVPPDSLHQSHMSPWTCSPRVERPLQCYVSPHREMAKLPHFWNGYTFLYSITLSNHKHLLHEGQKFLIFLWEHDLRLFFEA